MQEHAWGSGRSRSAVCVNLLEFNVLRVELSMGISIYVALDLESVQFCMVCKKCKDLYG